MQLTACRFDDPAAQHLLHDLYAEQLATYGFADHPADDHVDRYLAPEGLFLLASTAQGLAVGCGGYRTYDSCAGVGEVRKMFVSPRWRGLGVGWGILRELELAAVARGLTQMILETGSLNTAAIHLYSLAGYRSIPSYVQGRREINRAFSKHL
ncbi:GNAT family N-acetyltransferase [Kribbella sp. NBC_01245]|uniref:GNAT family N-acetyltransferase n=1 Tax=Kribbella sp. NBC_01245 TaxID=2903578 RepID=UPI002E2A2A04|nr:GNAT family N-acetyltransferase [Kribbella sp. NBC_01245]